MTPVDPNAERDRALLALGAGEFDLVVIGGGITGCGVARDAALRGYRVALVEKSDFAAGTSSKSSKLIHGGLRYLEHAEFRLVFEGTRERALLLRRAPHLVKPLAFLFPVYGDTRPGLFLLDVGLWIYDGLSVFRSHRLHRTFRPRRVLEREPGLRSDDLCGGLLYYDGLADDARLTLENALDARALGAGVTNHARAVRLARDPTGRVAGVEIEDVDPAGRGARVQIRARVVVNAAGPWSDEVRALAGGRRILALTKGIHLVVDRARLPVRHAIAMHARRDRRVMFAIPWGPRTVLGTTDTYHDASPDQVFATRDDAEYVLETANHYFPAAALTLDDVIATWAGLRPLIKPDRDPARASDVSREHRVFEAPGFVTIAGGKLTTYRSIAAEAVDAAERQLGRSARCRTEARPLPGAEGLDGEAALAAFAGRLATNGLGAARARHLVDRYGVRAAVIAERLSRDGDAAAPLDAELGHLMAEVDEAVSAEMARTLVDVLGRRVPLLIRARDQGLEVAPAVARRMARLLGWSEGRTREETDRYCEAVEETRRFRA